MPVPATLSDLQKMHRLAAELLVSDPVYLPIFLRIEEELAACQTQDDAISRARAIASRHRQAA